MKIDARLAQGLGLTAGQEPGRNMQAGERARLSSRLGGLDFSYWGPLKETFLTDESVQVRRAFAHSLGETDSDEAAGLLARLAGDGDWQVRERVAVSIKNLGAKSLLPVVLELLADDDPRVRAAAQRAYIKMAALHPELVREIGALSESGAQGLQQAVDLVLTQIDPPAAWTLSDASIRKLKGTLERGVRPGHAPDNPDVVLLMAEEHNVAYPNHPGVLREQPAPARETPGPLSVKGGKRAVKRYVNSWFEGLKGPDQWLVTDREYTLGIQVDPQRREGSRTQGEDTFTEPQAGDEAWLDVVVAISSEDFEVLEKPAKRIKVPRSLSESSQTATFRVRPTKNNQAVLISVYFYYKNNLFHEALVSAATRGQPTDEHAEASAYVSTLNMYRRDLDEQPSDLNIRVVIPKGKSEYRMTLFYDLGGDAFDLLACNLLVSSERLQDLLQGVHEDVRRLVSFAVFAEPGEKLREARREGRIPRLKDLDETDCGSALQILARAGRNLFVTLFDSSTGGNQREREQVRQMGERLLSLSAGRQLKLQVLSDAFSIPWNLLYDGDYPAQAVDPLGFWGFRHVIEEIPYRVQEKTTRTVIEIPPGQLPLGLNINVQEDCLPRILSEPQAALIRGQAQVAVHERHTEAEVLEAFCGRDGPYDVEYFFCHAGVGGELGKSFDKSYLGLTQDAGGLTLEDIKLATFNQRFSNCPLFILNACESGRMDGRFYDGFVPKFMNMGACAVVGTDNTVPALFGAHFGLELLRAFLQGQTLGAALRAVRVRLMEAHHNPLGLIYRVFGDADVRLSRPVS